MPTVPRVTPTVAPRPVDTPFQSSAAATEEAFGGGQARALGALGQTLGQTADLAAQIATQDEIDANERDTKERDVAYAAQEREILFGREEIPGGADEAAGTPDVRVEAQQVPGYFALQGKAAIDAHGSVVEQLTDLREQLAQGSRTQVAREMFLDVTGRRLANTQDAMGRHVMKARLVANEAVSAARTNEAVDRAIAERTNPEALAQSRAIIVQEARSLGEQNGLPEEAVESRIQEGVTVMHRGVIDGFLAVKDVLAAKEYFAAHKDDIDGRVHPEIERALATASNTNLTSLARQVRNAVTVLDFEGQPAGLPALVSAVSAIAATGNERAIGLNETLSNAIVHQAAVSKFNMLPMNVQASELVRLERKARSGIEVTAGEVEGIEKLRKNFARNDLEIREGRGLELAERHRIVQQLPEINMNAPDPQSLAVLKDQAQIASAHYGRFIAPLSDRQIKQVTGVLIGEPIDGSTAPTPNARIQVMRNLAKGLGEDGMDQIAQKAVEERPDIAMAMALATRRPATSRRIILGGQAFKDSKGQIKLTNAVRNAAITSVLGDVATRGNEDLLPPIVAAANSLYALETVNTGDFEEDQDRYELALVEASGGVVTHNGQTIIAPRAGMTQSSFDDAWENVREADLELFGNGIPVLRDGTKLDMDAIQQRGVFSSGPPMVLVSTGFGSYILFQEGTGSVKTDTGETYEFYMDRYLDSGRHMPTPTGQIETPKPTGIRSLGEVSTTTTKSVFKELLERKQQLEQNQ
jgi:hypothetical protein